MSVYPNGSEMIPKPARGRALRARAPSGVRLGWIALAGLVALYLSWQLLHWIPLRQELSGDVLLLAITLYAAGAAAGAARGRLAASEASVGIGCAGAPRAVGRHDRPDLLRSGRGLPLPVACRPALPQLLSAAADGCSELSGDSSQRSPGARAHAGQRDRHARRRHGV